MPITKAEAPTYFWPVTHERPDNGRFIKNKFDAEFYNLGQTRRDAIAQEAVNQTLTDVALVDEILAGWRGYKDEDNQEIPFSESAKAELLEKGGMRSAIINAYFASIRGSETEPSAQRKNS